MDHRMSRVHCTTPGLILVWDTQCVSSAAGFLSTRVQETWKWGSCGFTYIGTPSRPLVFGMFGVLYAGPQCMLIRTPPCVR
jgi:hypothetical protein